jgi:toxin ParE1/3/4
MTYNLEIRPLATLEILEAYEWYEQQQEGLGYRFLDSLEEFFFTLQNNPATFSYYEKPVREGLIKKFPYLVVFEIFDSIVVVYSVFMAKRNPDSKRTL